MPLMPMISAFVIALAGSLIFGLRPGFPFGALLLGSTVAAAMTGVTASVLQFLPQKYFIPAAIAAAVLLGGLVTAMLTVTESLGFGGVRRGMLLVWALSIGVGLLWSRAAGMRLPPLRRRRPAAR